MAIDFNHLADKADNTTYFYSSGIWNKPAGITMINIIVIGAGGGGAGGCLRVGAVGGCGGGGGGSGGISKITVPAILLPESLKITVGLGGAGGTGAGVPGSSGGSTFVDLPNNDGTATYRLINANGGGGGLVSTTSSVAGIGGSAGLISSINDALYSIFGVTSFVNGQAGGNGGGLGGAPTLTFGLTPSITLITGGGGGGGNSAATPGIPGAGGPINQGTNSRIPTLNAVQGQFPNGVGGVTLFQPFFYSLGGTGGSASNTTTGGTGGSSVIGAGGGGGGTGTSPGVGGAGGRGGNGLVIINCW